MKLRDLYSEYFAHWLSSGSLILRDKISSLGIKPSFDRFLTKKYVTKVWAIRYIPVYYNENFTEMVRTEMFIRFRTVKTTVNIVSKPVDIPVNSDQFKRKLLHAKERYDNYKEVFDSLSEADQLVGKNIRRSGGTSLTIRKDDLDRLKERYDSFSYVFDHTNKGGKFFESYIFIQASFEDVSEINAYRKALRDLLSGRDIYFTEIAGNISQYLNNFGPATYPKADTPKVPKVLLSDENLAHISPYRARGMIGGKGTLLGYDILSKTPLLVNFFGSSEAQVIVYIARSGVGKTFAVQMLTLALSAKTHHVSVIDLKGGEWEKLRKFRDIMVIDIDRFVNTLRIDDLEVDHDDCEFVFNLAVSSTVQLFSIMVNLHPNEGNISDLEHILGTAIKKVYSQLKGFNPKNPDTFHLTKHLKYQDVLDTLDEMQTSAKSLPDGMLNLINVAKTRCTNYLGASGELGDFMNEEITLSEVVNHPYVIYSLNKNVDATMTIKDDIKVFMVQHLSRKKHYIRRKQGLHTVEVYEELQRVDEIGSSSSSKSNQLLKFIAGVTSGSRSDNVMVILILNSIAALDNPQASAIRSNITTTVVGKVNELDVPEIASKLNCRELIPYMEAVSRGDDPNLKRSFAIQYDNGLEVRKTIYKVVVPSYVEKELRQRDVLED